MTFKSTSTLSALHPHFLKKCTVHKKLKMEPFYLYFIHFLTNSSSPFGGVIPACDAVTSCDQVVVLIVLGIMEDANPSIIMITVKISKE